MKKLMLLVMTLLFVLYPATGTTIEPEPLSASESIESEEEESWLETPYWSFNVKLLIILANSFLVIFTFYFLRFVGYIFW